MRMREAPPAQRPGTVAPRQLPPVARPVPLVHGNPRTRRGLPELFHAVPTDRSAPTHAQSDLLGVVRIAPLMGGTRRRHGDQQDEELGAHRWPV